MGMGAYDEDEHERREKKTGQVTAETDDDRSGFRGSIEYDEGDSTEALIEQFNEIKGD
ncbi:MAG: DUF5786 family protein [Haloferacaceae archaeon]